MLVRSCRRLDTSNLGPARYVCANAHVAELWTGFCAHGLWSGFCDHWLSDMLNLVAYILERRRSVKILAQADESSPLVCLVGFSESTVISILTRSLDGALGYAMFPGVPLTGRGTKPPLLPFGPRGTPKHRRV